MNSDVLISIHTCVCYLQLQAYFLVLDDIMDRSVTRRGRPCWYLYENLGTAAVNDGVLLENGLYQLLTRYFRDKPYYVHVFELFHDVSLIFVLKIRVS
jgi:farnesyl diphosphate synthase